MRKKLRGLGVKIGIDLDNTINANCNSKTFFSMLTKAVSREAEIFIITNRENTWDSRDKIRAELNEIGILYNQLCVTADKAKVIKDNNITVYFDDTDEFYLNIPSDVTVFKIREPGNFDFEEKKWVYGNKTGINIDKVNYPKLKQ